MLRYFIAAILAFVLLILSGCGGTEELGRVGDQPVTREEFLEVFNGLPAEEQVGVLEPGGRMTLMERIVRKKLLLLAWAEDPSISEGYEDLYWTYDWLLDNEGSYTFNMSYDSDGEEFDYFLSYSVVLNDDGSGSVDYYTLDEHLYKMEWDVLGNGSWELYPGTENAMSGSWTV